MSEYNGRTCIKAQDVEEGYKGLMRRADNPYFRNPEVSVGAGPSAKVIFLSQLRASGLMPREFYGKIRQRDFIRSGAD